LGGQRQKEQVDKTEVGAFKGELGTRGDRSGTKGKNDPYPGIIMPLTNEREGSRKIKGRPMDGRQKKKGRENPAQFGGGGEMCCQ